MITEEDLLAIDKGLRAFDKVDTNINYANAVTDQNAVAEAANASRIEAGIEPMDVSGTPFREQEMSNFDKIKGVASDYFNRIQGGVEDMVGSESIARTGKTILKTNPVTAPAVALVEGIQNTYNKAQTEIPPIEGLTPTEGGMSAAELVQRYHQGVEGGIIDSFIGEEGGKSIGLFGEEGQPVKRGQIPVGEFPSGAELSDEQLYSEGTREAQVEDFMRRDLSGRTRNLEESKDIENEVLDWLGGTLNEEAFLESESGKKMIEYWNAQGIPQKEREDWMKSMGQVRDRFKEFDIPLEDSGNLPKGSKVWERFNPDFGYTTNARDFHESNPGARFFYKIGKRKRDFQEWRPKEREIRRPEDLIIDGMSEEQMLESMDDRYEEARKKATEFERTYRPRDRKFFDWQ